MIKKSFRRLFKPIAMYFLSLFFYDKYLKGRYFEQNYIGLGWAFKTIWTRNILRLGKSSKLPMHLNCIVSEVDNLVFHPDDLHMFQTPGTYFQNFKAKITIGKGSYIAPNVGLITANHSFTDLDAHENGADINLGEKCWVGMNAIILPGVNLGPNTVVAAGAVVSNSFAHGNVVLAGVPAKIIKNI